MALGGPCWQKAGQAEVKGSDTRTMSAGQSFRTLAVLVKPGWNVGPWHTPSTSYAQDPSARARYSLTAPEEQALGKPPPGSLP